MFVRLPGLFEQLARLDGIALLSEGEQGFGVGPGSRPFIGILLKEACQVVIPVQKEQKAGQSVADSWLSLGLEPKHILEMLDGLVTTARAPK